MSRILSRTRARTRRSARSPGACGRTLPHAQFGLIGAPANAQSDRCQRSADRQKQRCAAPRPSDCRLRPLGGELERHTEGPDATMIGKLARYFSFPTWGGSWPHDWNRPTVWYVTYVTCFSRSHTEGARPAGRPGSLRPSSRLAIRPGQAPCPSRCQGTAACPGRGPPGR